MVRGLGVVVAMLAGMGGPFMGGAPGDADEQRLTASVAPSFVSCRVPEISGETDAAFETAFCAALVEYLTHDLAKPFQMATAESRGPGIWVEIRMTSPSRAEVAVSFGSFAEDGLISTSSITHSLTSYDRPLQPSAARTLVRDIGLGLGLVR